MLNGKLDQDQGRDSVCPDLGPNFLHQTAKVTASKSRKDLRSILVTNFSLFLASLAIKTAGNGYLSN